MLIAQRPAEGVWGGLWQFPSAELRDAEPEAEALQRVMESEFGLTVEVRRTLASLCHGIMNQRIELTAHACTVVSGRTRATGHVRARWVKPEELGAYALPAPHRRIADLIA